ncbi:MAG: TolC family protein, partial [Parachlamydiaceae bacterium]|nr:TolC family protein [Parachlamydiaceae bacterium]
YEPESISLPKAIEQALDCSLQLKEADARLQMKLAECWQAGVFPNPSINFSFNQVKLPNDSSCWDEMQSSLEISQLIEFGNKRTARQNLVAAEASIILWETELIRQNLIKSVTETYLDAFTAQKRLEILNQLHHNATNIVDCMTEKVSNGKASPIAQRKSILSQHAVGVELKKSVASLSAARRELASLCGGSSNCLQSISEPTETINPPISIENNLCLISKNAEIAQLEATQLVAQYNYILQKANSIPNALVSAGVVRYNGTGVGRHNHDAEYRLIVELEFELPVFNRNQGNISRAVWEEYSILYKIQDLERQLTVRCEDLYTNWIRTYETIELIQKELIPAAEEMLQIHCDREASGKEDCLVRMEANKDLFDLQLQYLDAVNEFYHVKANMRFLCGTGFEMIEN